MAGGCSAFYVSALNHAVHIAISDNGYDEYGNKINDNGGDVMDIKYDSNEGILDITDVEVRYWEKVGATSPLPLEEFGIRRFRMASGAINQDNTFFELYTGGAVGKQGLIYLGEGASLEKVPFFKALGNGIKNYVPKLVANRYLRIGTSTLRGREFFRVTYGNNKKHWIDIDLDKIPNIRK